MTLLVNLQQWQRSLPQAQRLLLLPALRARLVQQVLREQRGLLVQVELVVAREASHREIPDLMVSHLMRRKVSHTQCAEWQALQLRHRLLPVTKEGMRLTGMRSDRVILREL
jgi:hypothetical protein